jgi:hypothetical protein
MAILAGEKATAPRINEEIGVALQDTQDTSGTTTSTSYTATLTGGTACGIAFVAPPSGKVEITWTNEQSNSGASFSLCTIRVRTGATVGSGSDFLATSDNIQTAVNGTSSTTVTRMRLVTGLTPGSNYNVQNLYRVGANTGTFLRKNLIVKPQL